MDIVNVYFSDKKSIKAVFLDRDGVLNNAIVIKGKPHPPACLEELVLSAGVLEATCRLKESGYLLVVVTNQPDVARGATSKESVEQINQYLGKLLKIDEFRTCYHDNLDNCECRKPKPGAILQVARSRGIDLTQSFMVGDRWRDIEAGQAAGLKTVFIDYDYEERRPITYDYKATSLLGALPFILGEKNEKN